jgi:hypothetical protein
MRHEGAHLRDDAWVRTVAAVAALVLVGAPYAVSTQGSTQTRVGVPFDLHCPGRFTEYGGYEHPPPGTEHACAREADRRLLVSVGLVGIALVSATLLWRHPRDRAPVERG